MSMKLTNRKAFFLGATSSIAMLLFIGAAPKPGEGGGIKEYRVLESNSAKVLGSRVQAAIDGGWRIQGDVSASASMGGTLFAQAIVR